MARIRTIKPEFYRHEGLQDLEIAYPGKYIMLVFSALWGHCDSEGRFEWRPRQLKLDILPFLNFDMDEVLSILKDAGYIEQYEVDGKKYGIVITFREHQRLSGKELQDGVKFPKPTDNTQGSNREATGKQQGSDREIPESQEKEREKEKEGNRKGESAQAHTRTHEEKFLLNKEKILQETYLQTICSKYHFDFQKFKNFARDWIEIKELSEGYFSLPMLTKYLIEDFQKGNASPQQYSERFEKRTHFDYSEKT